MDKKWTVRWWQNTSYQTNATYSNFDSWPSPNITVDVDWDWTMNTSTMSSATYGTDAKIEDIIDFQGDGSYTDTGETLFTVHLQTYIHVNHPTLGNDFGIVKMMHFDQTGHVYLSKVDNETGDLSPDNPIDLGKITFPASSTWNYWFSEGGWYRIDIIYSNNMGGDKFRIGLDLDGTLYANDPANGWIDEGGTYVEDLGDNDPDRTPDYGLLWTDAGGRGQSQDNTNSRILFAGQGSAPNDQNGAILLNLHSFNNPFNLQTGLVLPRCAPVKYSMDLYQSTPINNNSLDVNGDIGGSSHPSDNTFDLSHIFSQGTYYNDNYIQVDFTDVTSGQNQSFNGGWSEVRADFAPIVVYYG